MNDFLGILLSTLEIDTEISLLDKMCDYILFEIKLKILNYILV